MTKTTHLSAILFSDIEGYTSIMQKDGKTDKAQQQLAKSKDCVENINTEVLTMRLAQYFAANEDDERAIKHLTKGRF